MSGRAFSRCARWFVSPPRTTRSATLFFLRRATLFFSFKTGCLPLIRLTFQSRATEMMSAELWAKFLACLKKSRWPGCSPSNVPKTMIIFSTGFFDISFGKYILSKFLLKNSKKWVGETGEIPVQCRYGKPLTCLLHVRGQVRLPFIFVYPV